MDTTKEVLFHPFIECIRAALEIVDTNFSYEAVMRFCGVDSVILRRTIWTGWTVIWLQPVSVAKRRGADDGGICHGRKRFTIWNSSKTPGKIYGYLEPFAAVFARKDARVSDGIRALYQLLTQLDTQHQLWNREQQLLAQGEETRSREYAQIYTIVMQLLENIIYYWGRNHCRSGILPKCWRRDFPLQTWL